MVEYNSDHIQEKSDVEHIRDLSSFYIKDKNSHEGLTHILKEVTDNSFDEAVSGREDVEVDIVIFRNKTRYQVLVRDTGRGVPIDKLKLIYSKTKTSGKWNGKAYAASTGIFGVGSTVTCSLSTRFMGISNRQEGISQVIFKEGNLLKDKIYKKKQKETKDNKFGTTVFFEPDNKIFKSIPEYMDGEGFKQVVKLLEFTYSFIYKGHITLRVIDKLIDFKELENTPKKVIKYFDNLINENPKLIPLKLLSKIDYVAKEKGISKNSCWKLNTVTKEKSDEDLSYEFDFFIPANNLKYLNTSLLGLVNMTRIDNPTSSHMVSTCDVLKKILQEYEEDESIKTYIELNYRIPLCGYIYIAYKGAVFQGANKDEFKDKKFLRLFSNHLESNIRKHVSKKRLEELYELLKKDIHNKYIKYSDKVLSLKKDLKNVTTRLNNMACYSECKSNDNNITELFIAEGTSAGGLVSQICDKEYQAVFKSRGKPINITQKSNLTRDKLYMDLLQIIGVSPHDKDLSNMNFAKVIILSDADPDGAHISALWVNILNKINPLIISEGKVYISNPPLYALKAGKTTLFLKDRTALLDTKIISTYEPVLDLYVNDFKLTGEAFRYFCYLINDVGDTIREVATRLIIDEFMLEKLIFCVGCLSPGNPETEIIRKILGVSDVQYRKDIKSLILIKEDTEELIRLDGVEYAIKHILLPKLKLMQWDRFRIRVSTKLSNIYDKDICSIMDIYNLFQKLDSIYHISRFKGLGGMNKKQLSYTCVNIHTRAYFKITSIGDVKKFYQLFGIDSSYRKKLIVREKGYSEFFK